MIFLSAEDEFKWKSVDAGIAVENMALAAESIGLGTLIIGRVYDTRKLQELELEGQNISYDTLQEIGCEYDEKKALDLCGKMKQIAIDSCETEEENLAV